MMEKWEDFLKKLAVDYGLTAAERDIFLRQFCEENRGKQKAKTEEEFATELKVELPSYKKYKTEIFRKFTKSSRNPEGYEFRSGAGKLAKLEIFLIEKYEDWITGKNNISPPRENPAITTVATTAVVKSNFVGREGAFATPIALGQVEKIQQVIAWSMLHHFNIPNPSRYFKGRDATLLILRQTFQSIDSINCIQVITGMGGMGKTQLAIQYAHQCKQDYSLIWWLRAETPATLVEDFASLTIELDLPEKAADSQSIRINAVKRWLSNQTHWLLIFDNAKNLKDIEPYLLPQGSGHTLITSQKQSGWKSRAIVLPLSKLPINVTIAFLLEQTGQRDINAVTKLAQNLDGLPLALAQASAYIDRTSCTIQAYLKLFQTCQTQLLDRSSINPDYNLTVATTWQLAFEVIEATVPAAAELLNLCAFLAPDDIPEVLFQHLPQNLSNELWLNFTNPLVFEEAIATLRDYSLIERGEDSLSLHRLVQVMVRGRMTNEGKQLILDLLFHLLKDKCQFDYYEISTWKTSSRWFPHGVSLIENTRETCDPHKTLVSIRLQRNIARYLMYQTRLDEADNYFKSAIKGGQYLLRRQTLCEADTHSLKHLIGLMYHNLSFVARCKNKFKQAAAYARHQVAIYTDIFGEQSPQTLNAISCLGCTYLHIGDIERSEFLIRQLLEIHNPDLLSELIGGLTSNLARILFKKGQFFEAIKLFKIAECKFLADSKFGETHFQTGILYYNMALTYEQMGEIKSANLYFGKTKVALRDSASYINNHCAVDFKELRQRLGLPEP